MSGRNKVTICTKIKNSILSIWSKMMEMLRILSMGKFDQGLYLDGRKHSASILGGLVTLSIILGVLVYSIILISWVFKGNIYYIQQSTELPEESGIMSLTVGDYIS